MRILWHSNAPWTSTGYGVQTRLFTPAIRDLGHDVALSAFYGLEGASITWNGMPVYPKAFHPYGMDVVASHARDHKADIVISLIDAWVMDPAKITASGARWTPWFPIDHETMPDVVRDKVKHAWKPITYARHAETVATDAGMAPAYVPHGVDTDIYRPHNRDQLKDKFGFPKDAFIIGIVAANKGVPSRKALPQQFEAFARFHERHPEAMLYLHTHMGPEMEGLDIPSVLQATGVKESAVKVCDQYRNIMGYEDDIMAMLYSTFDVLSSVTMGEGFGVPIIEAQACGTPVVIGDWTAMPELLGSGWKVSDSERILTPMGAYQHLPHVDAILDAYEKAYEARNDTSVRDKARAFAMKYDVAEVTNTYWKPVLEDMANRLDDMPAELPPVEVVK